MRGYEGSIDDLIEEFLDDKILFSPMNEHVLEFWKIRNEPNVMFLFYEDMKRNLPQEVTKVMKFLGKKFSQYQIDDLCKHLSFDSMKENRAVKKGIEIKTWKEANGEKYPTNNFNFIRKGQIGSYKEELTEEQNKKFNQYIMHPGFEAFDFCYKF